MAVRKRWTQAQRSRYYGGLLNGFPVDHKTTVDANGPKAKTSWEHEIPRLASSKGV